MKAKQLAQVIRKIVREEVQKEVRNVLTEQKVKSIKSENEERLTLSEALQQTETEEYQTIGNFNAADARAGFAAMQGGYAQPQKDINGRPVDMSRVDDSVTKAMTRDYSELVKRFKK
tara:strand:- start:905 stop:1255 length:351 start_codon:yes stop_codon:yes gene_type:complete